MRSRGTLLAVALVVAGLYGATVTSPSAVEPPESAATDRLVSPDGTDGYVWPYTSRNRSVTGRTLALNVVVLGEPDRVRQSLVDRSDANWSVTNRSVEISPWRPAHGSTRYTYITSGPNSTGHWITADYQLDVGTYFGRRTHLRAYASRSGDWTALQAHTEYWDWFRVRHTVTGVATGARFVEDDLSDEPFVESVIRTQYGSSGGEWTVIGLVPALVLAGVVAMPATLRLSGSEAALPIGLAGIILGVRAGGLAAEAAFPAITPKLFVVVGYAMLVAGPPILVTVLARGRPSSRTVLLTAAGLGAGITLDLAVVGVRSLPEHLLFHRVALVAALCAIALGASRRDRRAGAVGVVAWVLALAAPLLGIV